MRALHAQYLIDPLTRSPLSLTSLTTDGPHVDFGLLVAGQNWYPIIHGIPRILINELKVGMLQRYYRLFEKYRLELPDFVQAEWEKSVAGIHDLNAFLKHQEETAASFAYEWKYIYQENDYEKHNFFHFAGPFVTEHNIRGKVTVDIGCGSGRFTKWAALSGTTLSFGTDLGESVEVAYALTKEIANVCIVQADIYAMPFEHQFDLAYSIGVLHHLPEPEVGFSKLPPVLKSGGEMVIWVYNRRNNARALYFYEPLRTLLKKLPKPVLFKLCYVPGGIVHGINLFGRWLASIGFPKLEAKLPFAYYRHFPFNMKLNDAFDVLATPKSNYYYVEEVRDWFSRSGLRAIDAYEHPEAGITVRGMYVQE